MDIGPKLDGCMPPGAAFNWLTAAHSALQVLDHALKYRAAQAQLTRVPTTRVSRNQRQSREEVNQGVDVPATPAQAFIQQSSLLQANEAWLGQLQVAAIPLPPISGTVTASPNLPGTTATSSAIGLTPQESNPAFSTEAEVEPPAPDSLVLDAEAKMLQRHDPLPQGSPEALPQDVLPTISSPCTPLKISPGAFFPSRIRTAPSVLQSPVFPYWAAISLWR
jgi:hypothetical protein